MSDEREVFKTDEPASPGSNGALRDSRVGGVLLSPRPPVLSPGDQPQWIANLQVQRLLAVGMFACVAGALVQALISFGLAALHAISVGVVATVVYAAGMALGGRAHTRSLRRYTEYDIS